MASKTIVSLIDDLDGGEATQSVAFGLDGVQYKIDLSDENAENLRGLLADYTAAAHRIGTQRKARTYNKMSVSATREQNQAVRAWAREQGEDISDRGRIPADITARFQAAHPQN